LREYVNKHNATFVSLEAPHREALPCEGFRTFSIMRDPFSRLLSWINLQKENDQLVLEWMDTKQSHPPQYYFDGYSYVNCFVIRMLLGQERYRDPRPVDENDLQRAMARVDKFDAFVPLEHLNHPNVLSLLKRTVPEYHKELVRKRRKKIFNTNEAKWFLPTPEFLEQVRRENMYDIKLYEYVLEKLNIEAPTKQE
jgi:hypothetical protein